MRILDVNHPFFLPRWRRLFVVAFCCGWAVLEWMGGPSFWAVIASGFAAYSYFALIATFDPERAARGGRRTP